MFLLLFTSYFTNGITLVLLNRTPNVVEDIVIPMNSGLEVVVILQPKQKNTDGTPMFEVYGLTMTYEQHVLVGSTVRSYLSWLKESGRLEVGFENNRQVWKQM